MQPQTARASGPRPSPRDLILSEQPVTRIQLVTRPVLKPGIATVYATADGRASCPGRVLTRSDVVTGRYHTVYEVDASRHHCSFATTDDPLPARDDRSFFAATVAVDWHVSKPAAVVVNGVRDGERLVVQRVTDLIRLVSRKYDGTACEAVEREINRLAPGGGIELDGTGLCVDRISAHVTLDVSSRHYLQDQSLELEQARMRAIHDGVEGQFDLITRHLRHHPEDSLQVLQMMHERQRELEQQREARFENSTEMFTRMLDAGVIGGVEVETIPAIEPAAPDGSALAPTGVVGWRPRKPRDDGPGNAR